MSDPTERQEPNRESPRFQAVVAARPQLKRAAEDLGASGVSLTGSVARGQDLDESDIDFWLARFDGDEMTATHRAAQLVKAFRTILAPYSVDVRGEYFPGWPVDEAKAATMQRNAIDIDKL